MLANDWEMGLPPWLGEALPLGVIITDTALTIRYWSPWLEARTKTSATAMQGHSVVEYFLAHQQLSLTSFYASVLRGQPVTLTQCEHGALLPNSSTPDKLGLNLLQQRAEITPLRREGQIIGTLTIISETTEQRRTEQIERFMASLGVAMADSLEYQRTLDGTAQVIVPFMADWCVIEIGGQSVGAHFLAMAHVDPQQELALRQLQQVAPSLLHRSGSTEGKQSYGPPLLISSFNSELPDDHGADLEQRSMLQALQAGTAIFVPLEVDGITLGMLVLGRSVGQPTYTLADLALAQEVGRRIAMALEKVRLYADAEHSRVMAEEAVRLRDTFFSVAAHELRTPLTTLLGRSQLLYKWLAHSEGVDSRSLRSTKVIVEQAQRLNRMITALLDVSRIQSGRFSIDPAPMDLRLLVRQVVDETRLTISSHTISLRDPSEAVMVVGDEVRLEQVFQNLVSNAVKYSPVNSELRIEVRCSDNKAIVTVSDEGIGIPESAHEKLFSRFYRATNAEQMGISGLGLGLFVVNEIIDLHGGEITVNSTEGQGSSFIVHLPLFV